MKPEILKPWTKNWEWLVRISLFLMLMSALIQFGTFALTQSYLVSLMGFQTEDVSFILYMTYIGILATLPVQYRFLAYFESKSYLLFNMMLGMALSIASMHCDTLVPFLIIRFFQGVVIANIAGSILDAIFSRLKPGHIQPVGMSIFNGSILSSGILIGFLAAIVVDNADWKLIYRYLIIFQTVNLILVLLIFNHRKNLRRYPLYQMDWQGFVMFSLGGTAICYFMVYGNKYYWFSDLRITLAAFIGLVSTTAFVLRQLSIKRPLINLKVIKSGNLILGLSLLAFYYGIKDSINLIYSYTSVILQWNIMTLIHLAFVQLSGLVIFMIISAQLIMRNKNNTKYFLLCGFSMMLMYHMWMYFIFSTDLDFHDLALPVFLHGAGSGLLFVPIIIFTLSSAPNNTGTSGIVIMAYTRFFSTMNSVAGLSHLQLLYNRRFRETLLRDLDPTAQNVQDKMEQFKKLYQAKGFSGESAQALADNFLNRLVTQQSQILTNRHIFMVFSIAIIAVIMLIIFLPMIRTLYLSIMRPSITLPE